MTSDHPDSNKIHRTAVLRRMFGWFFELVKSRRLRRDFDLKLIEATLVGVFAAISALVSTLLDHRDVFSLLFSKQSVLFVAGIALGMLTSAGVFSILRWYYRRNENIQRARRVLVTTYLTALKFSPLNPERGGRHWHE